MQTVKLGNTGVEVSALCFGAIWMGTRTDPTTSTQLLDAYVAAGGAFIDTANIYSFWIPNAQGGESERFLGEWMRARGNRQQLFIATKLGFAYPGCEQGLRASQIETECEKSLKRMGIETIDLFYAHCDDRQTPLAETLQAFDRLVKAGKVRFTGASNFRAWRLAEAQGVSQAHNWAVYSCIQQRYSYIRPKPGADFGGQLAANDDLLDYCRVQGMPLLAYSPLLSGLYTRLDQDIFSIASYSFDPKQYSGPDTVARLAVLQAVAQETGATPNQVVLAWMLQQRDLCIIPLLTVSRVEHLRDNLQALQITLSAEQMQRLNLAGA